MKISNHNSKIKNVFTLIELIAAMGVFSILMLIMLTFFDGAQKAWTNCINRSQIYENARVAFDLITRDLQCAYYEYEKIPFWHKGFTTYSGSDSIYDQQLLAFTSVTSILPNDNCKSKICEVKYQLYNYDGTNGDAKKEGWLMRSVTGDAPYSGTTPNSRWNYYISTTPWAGGIVGKTGSIYSADGTSSGDGTNDFQKVIPYVTYLDFKCYDRIGNEITANNTNPTAFPYSVRIEISILDQVSWTKWKQMGGQRYVVSGSIVSDPKSDFRTANERTFVKTVVLGERGQ